MQFTITTILALAAASSVSAAAIPADKRQQGEGEYIGQFRGWRDADTCGVDFNMGYVKQFSGWNNKCQPLDMYAADSVLSGKWEGRPEGWVGELYTDADCSGIPTLVNDDCVSVGERQPDFKAWQAFKIVGPQDA